MGGSAGLEGVGAGAGAGAGVPVHAGGLIGSTETETANVMIIGIGMGEDLTGSTVTVVVGESLGVLSEAEALQLLGKGVRSGELGLNNGIEKGKRRCKKSLFGHGFIYIFIYIFPFGNYFYLVSDYVFVMLLQPGLNLSLHFE